MPQLAKLPKPAPDSLLERFLKNRREVEQGPSVLDAPGEGAVRELMDLIGTGLFEPAAGMVSKYAGKGAAGLANRKWQTGQSLDQIYNLLETLGIGGSDREKIMVHMAQYPRTLAHVGKWSTSPTEFSLGQNSPLLSPKTAAKIPGGDKLSRIDINRLRGEPHPDDIAPDDQAVRVLDTLIHELTHGAQRITKGADLDPDYAKINENVGYRNNPYERGADKAGRRNVWQWFTGVKPNTNR